MPNLSPVVPVRVLACAALLAALLTAACGKKGPPLAPLPRVPVAPPDASVQRAGDQVAVRFTVPTANVSGIRPADVERVEVYGLTSTTVPPDQFLKHATAVGSVPVRRPAPPPADEGEEAPPPPPSGPGLEQGERGQVVETLTPEAIQPLVLPRRDRRDDGDRTEPPLAPPNVAMPGDLPVRHYVAVGVNHRGRKGPASPRLPVPLWQAPAPPGGLQAAVTESAITLTWTAPERLRGPILPNALPAPPPAPAGGRPARTTGPGAAALTTSGSPSEVPASVPAAAPEAPAPENPASQPVGTQPLVTPPPVEVATTPPPRAAVPREPQNELAPPAGAQAPPAAPPLGSRMLYPWPVSSSGYTVYEVAPPGAGRPVLEPGAMPPFPNKLNDAPVTATTYADPTVVFGVERCFVVRTLETVASLSLESEDSEPVCVTPQDIFAPAAPRNLAAVASEGGISLIWEGNTEPDLAGYVVLRGESGSQSLQPLTPDPIRETTFRDTSARPGTTYVYAVLAVDKATPANVSPQSNRVEETAR